MFEDYEIDPLPVPQCGRCGRETRLLHRLTIQRDSELRKRQTAYWDLCVGCLAVVEHMLHMED
jgi:hypothetical protein